MCGRAVTGDVSWQEYHEWMSILQTPDTPIKSNYNVAPTTMNPIFIPDGEGMNGVFARWGLVPQWYRKPVAEMKFSTFNARSEEAHEKPVFRDAMKSRRCLVPVKGYFEWTGTKGNKTPFFISVKTNAPAFCLAGLYSKVELPDFSGYTYTVLTEASGGPIKGLHNRMPVMLDESDYSSWLAAETPLDQIARVDPSRIEFHEVGSAVGNVRNRGSHLIDRIA